MRIMQYGRIDRLVLTGDWHEGNGASHEEGIRRCLTRCEKYRWAGMGDMMECILPGDKRFSVEEHHKTSMEVKATIVDRVKKARTSCAGLLSGNHEETVSKSAGSMMRDICREAEVPFLTSTAFLHFGPLLIFLTHKSRRMSLARVGPIRLIEAKRKEKLQDAFRFVEADLCAMGHIHTGIVAPPDFEYRLTSDGKGTKRRGTCVRGKWCASIPALFRVYDENAQASNYAEQECLEPTSMGWLEVVFNKAGDKIEAIEQYNEKGKLEALPYQ